MAGRDPACSVAPKWDVCKYHLIQWQREYRWRHFLERREWDAPQRARLVARAERRRAVRVLQQPLSRVAPKTKGYGLARNMAYYDKKTNDCYYFRGCPDNNQELFTYDVDCREACVTGDTLKLRVRPSTCFHKPMHGKCNKKVKK
ncbi:hypothetical protein MSG28_008438 [Choristoneura fumiferana]|uniref:Uncharacterized protein n=1 Tax=Choristoneura fumiferana TaxID=7141 RepID=A0ACC0J6X3_CHOFU|nr:hypothetical protein MSG28_008438 [Choristoneura fumiferana]